MKIMRLLKLKLYIKRLTRLKHALENSFFYVSTKKQIRMLQIIQYIRANQSLPNLKIDIYELDHLVHIIKTNNAQIDTLVTLVKEFISMYDSGYFKPNSHDFDNQIRIYKSALSQLSEKKTANRTILKGNRIYIKLFSQYLQFLEDERLFEQLKLAALSYHQLPIFIDYETTTKLVTHASHIQQILKKEPKFKFSTLAYQETINFYISLSDSIKSHNIRFIYEYVFTYYQSHKKDKYFDLESYLDQLMSDNNFTWQILDEYLDAYQTKTINPFETWLEKRLKSNYPEVKIIRSLYLSTGSRVIPSTEIDLLMFYKGHILVIECKDYRGTIYGSYSKPVWTQSIKTTYQYKPGGKYYTKNSSFELNNPIKQNEMHISVLNKYIPFAYKNVVVFGGDAELKVASNNAYTPLEFFKMINELEEINTDTKGIYYKFLLENIGSNPSVKSRHIEAIQSKYGN